MSVRSHSDAVTDAEEAELLGSYVLSEELAVGGLASVHVARTKAQRSGASDVVVKRLRAKLREDGVARARLLVAARVLRGVRVPHLANVVEVHEEPEPFVVLERIDGVSLDAILRAATSKDAVRFAMPVLVDVLCALHRLHELNIVHGAPHARHLMVGSDGRGCLVDLTHAVGPAIGSSFGHDERLLPSEMAPEQVLIPNYVDRRCDLFIVGGVLWRSMTGKKLFDGADREAALQSMLHQCIAYPSDVANVQSRELERTCMRLLARSRGKRYGSACEVADALREHGQQSGCMAQPDEIAAFVRGVSTELAAQQQGQQAAARRTTLIGVGSPELALDAGARLATHARGKRRAFMVRGFEYAPEQIVGQSRATPESAEHAPPAARADPQELPPPARSREGWREASPSCPPQRREVRKFGMSIVMAASAALLATLIVGLWQTPTPIVRSRSHGPEAPDLLRASTSSGLMPVPSWSHEITPRTDAQRATKPLSEREGRRTPERATVETRTGEARRSARGARDRAVARGRRELDMVRPSSAASPVQAPVQEAPSETHEASAEPLAAPPVAEDVQSIGESAGTLPANPY